MFTLIHVILLTQSVYVFSYKGPMRYIPPVRWDPENPLFRDETRMTIERTNRYVHIYIDMWDEIFFSCPNPVQKDWVSSVLTHPNYLFENMWVVSRKEFDNCTLDESSFYTREMLRCDSVKDYTECKYRKMRVRPIADGIKSIEFHPGQTYYLIATSNGTEEGLDRKAGGRCETHNMRLAITVCPGGSKCSNNENIYKGPPTEPPTTTTTTTTSTTSTTTEESTTTVPAGVQLVSRVESPALKGDPSGFGNTYNTKTILFIVFAFVVGCVIGGVLTFMLIKCSRKRDKKRCNSDGSSSTDSEVFTTDSEKTLNMDTVKPDNVLFVDGIDDEDQQMKEANRKYFSNENPAFRNSTEFKRLLSTSSQNFSNERYSVTPVGEYS